MSEQLELNVHLCIWCEKQVLPEDQSDAFDPINEAPMHKWCVEPWENYLDVS
jgi:hypothetical protein